MNNLPIALIITLIGMGIVFIVLIALAYILKGLKLISVGNAGDKNISAKQSQDNDEIGIPDTSYSGGMAAERLTAESANDSEFIAAISAAIAAYLGSENNIVVRSIRRVEDNTPTWARIGRHEQMRSRL